MEIAEKYQRYVATYHYLYQDKFWIARGNRVVQIADMDGDWRLNCARMLERNAKTIETFVAFGTLATLPSDISECAEDAIEGELDRRADDPLAWLRQTPLYRALYGLPQGGGR